MSEKVNKKTLKAAAVTAIVLVFALTVVGVIELVVGGKRDSLDYLKAGKRWSSDGSPYAVIAAYTDDDNGFDESTLGMWEHSMESALTEAAVSSVGGRRWAYAASFETELTVSAKKTTTALVTVAVGDFFTFHTYDFVFGSGFLNDMSNPMGVVLDEDLAWKLFGATNVVGMTFTAGGEEYTVSGVYKPEKTGGAYGYTYGKRPRMIMSGRGYAKIGQCSYTTYEAVLPNPVKSFAKNIFDNVIRLNEDKSDIIEATKRFSLENRFSNMKKLTYSWININTLEYPYWENEARVSDYRCARLMIFEIIFASVAGAALIASIVLVVVSGYTPVASVKNLFGKAARHKKTKQ